MPRHLPLALVSVAAWPRLVDTLYWENPYPGLHVEYPAGGARVVEYLHSLAVWQLFGFTIDAVDRAEILELWKHRTDLRAVLGQAIGHYVCDEFKRPFLRGVLAGGGGGVREWVAAYPDLRAPLLAHYREMALRYQQPFEVIRACTALTRELGEPPEVWRAAALAIKRDDRRQSRRPPELRSDFLRHDLEDHGTISGKESAIVNLYLDELGCERVDVMTYGAWWHPRQLPSGQILARVARASHALAGERWGEVDEQVYARALAAMPASAAASFETELEFLRRIAAAAGVKANG
jgi:hypothetical protein